MVLKELIFNSFSYWDGWGGPERTEFLSSFNFGEDVVLLKELIFNSFSFGWVWWSWKKLIFNSFCLEECGVVLKEIIFHSFYCWECVVIMKELIFNSLYFGRVWWSWKNWFLTVSTLVEHGGPKRTDFLQFLIWDGLVVLRKKTDFNSFSFRGMWWSWKNWFLTVSTLGWWGGLRRTNF